MNFSQLMALASGHVEARIVQTAVELAVFDSLEAASLTSQDIAKRLSLEAASTELMLNALAAMDLLQKRGDLFSLSPVAKEYLLKTSLHDLSGMIRFDASLWGCWEKLPLAIRTGQPVRSPNMYQDDQRETEIFINAMDSLVKARGDTAAMASALDWHPVVTLLDVGSGPATYPIELCTKFPKLRATVFDLPGTLKITERYIAQAGLAERIRLVAGDYRSDSVPGSYDLILLSNVIHGENPAKNEALMRKLAANLNRSGQLVIKDHILDETRTNPPMGAIFSLLMLLTTDGGRCYSFMEIKRWLERAGLKDVRQIDLAPPLTSSLVIGAK